MIMEMIAETIHTVEIPEEFQVNFHFNADLHAFSLFLPLYIQRNGKQFFFVASFTNCVQKRLMHTTTK